MGERFSWDRLLKRNKVEQDNTIEMVAEQETMGPVAPLHASGMTTPSAQPAAESPAPAVEEAEAKTKAPLVIDWSEYQQSNGSEAPAAAAESPNPEKFWGELGAQTTTVFDQANATTTQPPAPVVPNLSAWDDVELTPAETAVHTGSTQQPASIASFEPTTAASAVEVPPTPSVAQPVGSANEHVPTLKDLAALGRPSSWGDAESWLRGGSATPAPAADERPLGNLVEAEAAPAGVEETIQPSAELEIPSPVAEFSVEPPPIPWTDQSQTSDDSPISVESELEPVAFEPPPVPVETASAPLSFEPIAFTPEAIVDEPVPVDMVDQAKSRLEESAEASQPVEIEHHHAVPDIFAAPPAPAEEPAAPAPVHAFEPIEPIQVASPFDMIQTSWATPAPEHVTEAEAPVEPEPITNVEAPPVQDQSFWNAAPEVPMNLEHTSEHESPVAFFPAEEPIEMGTPTSDEQTAAFETEAAEGTPIWPATDVEQFESAPEPTTAWFEPATNTAEVVETVASEPVWTTAETTEDIAVEPSHEEPAPAEPTWTSLETEQSSTESEVEFEPSEPVVAEEPASWTDAPAPVAEAETSEPATVNAAELFKEFSQDPSAEPVGEVVPMYYRTREAEDFDAQVAKDRRLGDVLTQHKLITQAQLQRALDRQAETREKLGQILVAMQAITERRLLQALAAQKGVSPWHLEDDAPSQEALAYLNKETCKLFQVLPVAVRGDLLLVAMRDPSDAEAIEAVRQVCNLRVEPVLADDARLAFNIDKAYGIAETRRLAQVDKVVAEAMKAVDDLRAAPGTGRTGTENEVRPVIGLVNQLIEDGIRMRASDLHIEPRLEKLEIRYRLDGRLVKTRELPIELANMIAARVKSMADLNIADHRNPQEGRISAQFGATMIDLRVSVLPNSQGPRIAIRILDKAIGVRRLANIGFSPENLALFKGLLSRPHGLLLVTGPTGAGKTTTLYSALGELTDDSSNLMTVEDPIEYELEGVSQIQVNEKAGLTFSSQLRAILRQDPDVVLIGEIRDKETAETAIRAALSGHLVLSTLHCSDATGVVARMSDMGVDSYLLSSALIGSMGQRLLRVLCPDCKEAYEPTDEEKAILRSQFGAGEIGELWKPTGCDCCFGTGYRGRIAVHEILPVTDEIRHQIAEKSKPDLVKASASKHGFRPMQLDALERILNGQTSLAEALRVLGGESVAQTAA